MIYKLLDIRNEEKKLIYAENKYGVYYLVLRDGIGAYDYMEWSLSRRKPGGYIVETISKEQYDKYNLPKPPNDKSKNIRQAIMDKF